MYQKQDACQWLPRNHKTVPTSTNSDSFFFNSSYFSIPAYFTPLPSCCFSVFFSKERSEFYYILFSSYTCFPLFSFLFLSNPLLSCLSSVVLQWYFKPGILSIYTKLLIIFLSNLISFFLFRDSSDSQPYNSQSHSSQTVCVGWP